MNQPHAHHHHIAIRMLLVRDTKCKTVLVPCLRVLTAAQLKVVVQDQTNCLQERFRQDVVQDADNQAAHTQKALARA